MDEYLIGDNQTVEPEKFDLRSHDIAEDKRKELLNLFPEIRTEGGKLDFDRLKLALGESVDIGKERYGMNWPGKADCFKTIQMPSLATLRPCPEESINFDTTENLIIEGDNLEVLKLLQKSYLGKVKMIYIDPPYNTGNDFIYPDNYSESLQTYLEYTGQVDAEGRKFGTNTDTDGRFHSKWLNMMYPRLYLARNLLNETGFIFVSIDDTEGPALIMLLNEIFGEENQIAVLAWDRNRKNDAKYFSVRHEYMLVYAKSKQRLLDDRIVLREPKDGIDWARKFFDALCQENGGDWGIIRKKWKEIFRRMSDADPRKQLGRFTKVGPSGPFRDDGDISWPGGGGPKYEVLHPETGKPCKMPAGGWVYPTPERFWQEVKSGRVVFGPDETTLPRQCRYLLNGEGQVMPSVFYSYAQTATMEFVELMGERVFENPKNWKDIRRIVRYVCEKDDVVLDFFAGSGTTAHAVLDLNKQDGGNRKFILVQLPEPTARTDYSTITEICKERVRRVIQNLNADDSQQPSQQTLALTPTPALPLKWGGSGSSVPSNIKNMSGGERNHLKSEGSGGIIPSPCEGEGQDGGAGMEQANNSDRGFKVLKLAESNFKPWEAERPNDAESLARQLDLHIDHIRDGRTAEDLLYELLLKSGFPLTTPVELLAFPPHPNPLPPGERGQDGEARSLGERGKDGGALGPEGRESRTSAKTVYSVADGALFICLERELTLELIRAMAEKKPERIVCLDEGFAANDQLKANAVQIFKTKGITSFKTV